MKNKTKTYILIVAVLGIWGTVAYQFFTGINPKDKKKSIEEQDTTFKPQEQKAVDTFSITAAKRDPFLGTLAKKRVSEKFQKKKIDIITQLPNIVYKGLVKKQQTNQQVFVINIDNAQYLLRKGQAIKSVTLLKGNSEEIVVRVNNKNMTIPIQ